MERAVIKNLQDILDSINEIDSYFQAGEKRYDVYRENLCIRRAIQMNIAIIGEAMNRVLKALPDVEISSARKIVDTRNYLIHGYDSLNHEIIWAIVIRHLPALKREIEAIMQEQ